MLSGYNTDIKFEGVTYHIQSEDRGRGHMVVETLIYCGGAILNQIRTPYAGLVRQGGGEAEIARLLDQQHRDAVRRARHGEFQTGATQSLDSSGLSLPDLAEGFHQAALSAAEMEWLKLDWKADKVGVGLAGKLRVRTLAGGEPVSHAMVTVRLVGKGLDPLDLINRETDSKGMLEVATVLPPKATAVIFRAEKGLGGGRLRLSL